MNIDGFSGSVVTGGMFANYHGSPAFAEAMIWAAIGFAIGLWAAMFLSALPQRSDQRQRQYYDYETQIEFAIGDMALDSLRSLFARLGLSDISKEETVGLICVLSGPLLILWLRYGSTHREGMHEGLCALAVTFGPRFCAA